MSAFVVAVLLLAFVLRAGLVLETRSYPLVGDSFDYARHARAIANTLSYPGSLDGPDGGPTAFRPPGYPVFLAVIYAIAGQSHFLLLARLVQALLGVVVSALTGLVCWQLWGRRVALIALVIASLFPSQIVVGSALLSETLFLVFELAACAAVLRQRHSTHKLRWAAAAGVCCGLAALTRTVGALLIVPIAIGLLGNHAKGWRHATVPALTLLLATALTVAPWTARNAIVMHSFIPVSTEGGATLAGAYNETVARRHVPWARPSSLPDFAPLYWRPQFRSVALRSPMAPGAAPRAWRTDLTESALDNRLRSAALGYIADHPLHALKKAAFNAATQFELRGPGQARYSFEELALGRDWALRLATYGLYPVFALALLGALTAQARRAPRWLWLIAIVILPAVFIEGLTRLRSPMDPILIVLAALAVGSLAERLGGRVFAGPARTSTSGPPATP
ncbi:MAG: hypothetical protein NVS2B6_11680 [Thermoleophilaceae bacterium]